MRRVAWEKVKVTECNLAWAGWALHVDRCLQRSQGHAHVRWIGCNAMLTCAQNCEHAVAAADCWTARSGFALVTGHRGVSEVHATCSLKKIARGGRHVTKLHRGSGKYGLG